MTEVAIRRRLDGLYLVGVKGGRGTFKPAAKFVETHGKARMIVRTDLGEDTDKFEFLTREQVAAITEAAP